MIVVINKLCDLRGSSLNILKGFFAHERAFSWTVS